MNYNLKDYETAIVNTIDSLGYLKTVKGYSGEFTTEASFRQFSGNLPSVLVRIERVGYNWQDNQFFTQILTVSLLICTRSWRTQDDARNSNVGVYTVLDDIRTLLLGKRLSLQIMPIELLEEIEIGADLQNVLFGARYQITNPRIQYTIDN